MLAPVRGRTVGLLAAALALSACTAQGAPSAASTTTPPRTTAPATSPTAAPTPAATPTPTEATAPDRGTTLLALQGGDTVIRNTAGRGFSVLSTVSGGSFGSTQEATITAYDAAGRQVGQVAGGAAAAECGAADVSTADRRLIVTLSFTSRPAQGIMPAQYGESLLAFDARTGAQAWRAEVVPPQTQPLDCGSGQSPGGLQGFQATRDGAWGVLFVQGGDLSVADAVDLTTGRLYPRADLQGVLGNQLVTGRTDSSGPGQFTLTTPPQWPGLGSFSTGSGPGVLPLTGPSDAVTGKFPDYGDSAGVGLSSDETLLFAVQPTYTGNYRDSVLTAFSLPTMAVAWRQDTTGQGIRYALLGAGGTVLVVQRQADGGTTTDGLDARTGQTLWTLPELDGICGLSGSQMLVQANSQVAVIDLATGTQVSYSGSSTGSAGAGCPEVLPGGIAVTDGAVVQALAP